MLRQIFLRHRTSYYTDKRFHPRLTAFLLHIFFDRQRDDPFYTGFIMGVFPLWPDSFLKKHVICIWHYFFNRIDVMKHPPEVFDRVKTVNLMKDVFVMTSSFTLLFFLVVTESVNVPKSPSKRKINIINTTFSLKKH